MAVTPWPASLPDSLTRLGSSVPEYASRTLTAMGWSEKASAWAASSRRSSSVKPDSGWVATTLNSPFVSVPVLSNTTVSTSESASR